MIAFLRRWSAQRRLQRMVDANARSRSIMEYRIRRAAAKQGWRKRKGIVA